MSRKDYKTIAAALFAVYRQHIADKECRRVVDAVVSEIANALKRDNPRFDHAKFFAACYGEE